MNDSTQTVPDPTASDCECSVTRSISSVSAADWNRLVPEAFPFLRHEFLGALEETGCVSVETGWLPQHIVIRRKQTRDNEIIAAMPLYLKGHSYGEYIFDWQWASAYQRAANQYYPKLVCQSPFTPLTAPKFLIADHGTSAVKDDLHQRLLQACYQLAKTYEASSIHWLFLPLEQSQFLASAGLIPRQSTFEYIWRNRDYQDMDDFLATLRSRKRKKIRQERQSLTRRKIHVRALEGPSLKVEHWQALESFYLSTLDKYYAQQYLNFEFFQRIGSTLARNIVMFLAYSEGQPIAGSLCVRGGDHLYGRYWGALQEVPNLHFETCYYAAIEYCIVNGLQTYNAGVQGDHKLSRGFLPEPSYSAHFIDHPLFAEAIRESARQETSYVRQYRDEMATDSPYQKKPEALVKP